MVWLGNPGCHQEEHIKYSMRSEYPGQISSTNVEISSESPISLISLPTPKLIKTNAQGTVSWLPQQCVQGIYCDISFLSLFCLEMFINVTVTDDDIVTPHLSTDEQHREMSFEQLAM